MYTILTLPRFWSKVAESPSGCWIWTGGLSNGYSSFKYDGERIAGHLLTYRAMIGKVPVGLELDHLCRVRRCVNPYHLDAVPKRVNILRGEGPTARHARQDDCGKDGHGPYIVRTFKAKARRVCRDCEREAAARSRARKRGVHA